LAPQLETLARKIAGNAVDAITLERAREIAQAELELARVQRAKFALIESEFGELDPPQLTVTQMIRILNAFDRRPCWSWCPRRAGSKSREWCHRDIDFVHPGQKAKSRSTRSPDTACCRAWC